MIDGQRKIAEPTASGERRMSRWRSSNAESERRKVPRRRQIDPTTCERDYTDDEIEFMQALDAYKRVSGRMFPTCSEILEVIRDMGYVRLPPGNTLTPEPQEASAQDDGAIAEATSSLEA